MLLNLTGIGSALFLPTSNCGIFNQNSFLVETIFTFRFFVFDLFCVILLKPSKNSFFLRDVKSPTTWVTNAFWAFLTPKLWINKQPHPISAVRATEETFFFLNRSSEYCRCWREILTFRSFDFRFSSDRRRQRSATRIKFLSSPMLKHRSTRNRNSYSG